jgi:hypothetical protein
MALKPEDRQIVRELAIGGEAVLRQRGWNKERRDTFLSRKDVQRELQDLDSVYKEREQLAERARFFGMTEMQKMVPRAVQVLQRALLAGSEVNGQIIDSPDEGVLEAALQVLDRTGVSVGKGSKEPTHGDGLAKINGPVTINNISVGDDGAATAGKTLMREKLRTRIAEMLHAHVKEVTGTVVEGRVTTRKRHGRPGTAPRLPAPAEDGSDDTP